MTTRPYWRCCEAIEERTRWNNLLREPDARTLDLAGIGRADQGGRADRSRICLSVPAQTHPNHATWTLNLDDETVSVVTGIALLQPAHQVAETLAGTLAPAQQRRSAKPNQHRQRTSKPWWIER